MRAGARKLRVFTPDLSKKRSRVGVHSDVMSILTLSPIAHDDSLAKLQAHGNPGRRTVLFDLQGLHKPQKILGFKAE